MSGKPMKPFKVPYNKKTDSCPACKELWMEHEKRLFILEGRVKELEQTIIEAMEDSHDDGDNSIDIGSQDSLDDEFVPRKLKRENAQIGKQFENK